MKFFLDSAQTNEITHALEMWNIDGVTTNPRHIQASGKPFMKVISEIGDIFCNTDRPISVEVNPHLTDYRAMVEEASKLAAMCSNFVIKLPATEAGFKSIPVLAEKGIRSNLTLVFSTTQALQAMRMGAAYVSAFIGWKESNGEDTVSFVNELVEVRDNYAFDCEIIIAAVRNGRQIAEAALAGADIVTAGFQVFQESFDHPYTHDGLGRFQRFWDQTQYA